MPDSNLDRFVRSDSFPISATGHQPLDAFVLGRANPKPVDPSSPPPCGQLHFTIEHPLRDNRGYFVLLTRQHEGLHRKQHRLHAENHRVHKADGIHNM